MRIIELMKQELRIAAYKMYDLDNFFSDAFNKWTNVPASEASSKLQPSPSSPSSIISRKTSI